MSVDPQLAKIVERAEKVDKFDITLAVEIAQYVREEMGRSDARMADRMQSIEDRITEQVRAAVSANAGTVKRITDLETTVTDLKQDLVHTRYERAEKEVEEAEARYKIALKHKDGLSTQERIEVRKEMDERLTAVERARQDKRRAFWGKVLPNVTAALIVAIVAPVGLGLFIAILVFILRALGVEIQFPT